MISFKPPMSLFNINNPPPIMPQEISANDSQNRQKDHKNILRHINIIPTQPQAVFAKILRQQTDIKNISNPYKITANKTPKTIVKNI
jgi:hypothetical protein